MKKKLNKDSWQEILTCILGIFVFACNSTQEQANPASRTEHKNHTVHENHVHQSGTARIFDSTTNERIAVVSPQWLEAEDTVDAYGKIEADARRNKVVPVRFGGRIEKLFIRYPNQFVRKGEKVAEIYSPEMLTEQKDYLVILSNRSQKDSGIMLQSREKLKLLGLTEEQILMVEKTNSPIKTLAIYSAYTGYVIFNQKKETVEDEKQMQNPGMEMGEEMKNNKPISSSTEMPIREGMYVSKGQMLFQVNDLQKIWAIISVYAKEMEKIKEGMSVEIGYEANEKIIAKIDFIERIYKEGQQTATIRVYVDNENKNLKTGTVVKVKIFTGKEKILVVPNSAVLDLGRRKIVWLKDGMEFKAREVVTGKNRNEWTEIISGITEKNKIAKDAGYLLDSESLVNPPKMNPE